MKLCKIANSRNDEYYTPYYAIEPLLKYIPEGKSIWCPFDTNESIIVKALREKGHGVFATHISTGQDFFKTVPEDDDLIISNPPYSMKTEVFERLFEIGKPFAMLVGVVGIFESQRRFNMFANNDLEIMWLNKRVSYLKSYQDDKTALNPPFSSVWLCSGLLPEKNIFETIDKKGRIR